MLTETNVEMLVDEYAHLSTLEASDDIVGRLVSEHDWTLDAAMEIHRLATEKGSFLLRNALALSIALNIEDGDQGF